MAQERWTPVFCGGINAGKTRELVNSARVAIAMGQAVTVVAPDGIWIIDSPKKLEAWEHKLERSTAIGVDKCLAQGENGWQICGVSGSAFIFKRRVCDSPYPERGGAPGAERKSARVWVRPGFADGTGRPLVRYTQPSEDEMRRARDIGCEWRESQVSGVPKPERECEECGGTGWIDDPDGGGRCHCPTGEYMGELFAENRVLRYRLEKAEASVKELEAEKKTAEDQGCSICCETYLRAEGLKAENGRLREECEALKKSGQCWAADFAGKCMVDRRSPPGEEGQAIRPMAKCIGVPVTMTVTDQGESRLSDCLECQEYYENTLRELGLERKRADGYIACWMAAIEDCQEARRELLRELRSRLSGPMTSEDEQRISRRVTELGILLGAR
jgi:hypothetical protein